MKILYYDCAGHERIIKVLQNKFNHKPVILTWHNLPEIHTLNNFKRSFHIDNMNTRNAIYNYQSKWIKKIFPPDENTISKLSQDSFNFFSSLGDSNGWNFSYQERKEFFYETIKYWNTILNNIEIDAIVYFTVPHDPSALVSYYLAKKIFNKKTFFIDPYPIFFKYNMISESLDYNKIVKNNKNIDKFEINKNYNIISKNITPQYILKLNTVQDKRNSFSNLFLTLFKQTLKTLIMGSGFKKIPSDWKKNRISHSDTRSKFNYLEYTFFLIRLKFSNYKLNNYYEKLCEKKINYKKKYIFFASSVQPEARFNSTCGIFQDQYLVLDMLDKNLPHDWKIYYKEHPSIFKFKGSLARSVDYYQKIKKLKKVIFISQKENQFNLIQNSQATSTIGGTAGFESFVRQKPVILFGNSFYKTSKKIFKINSNNDLKIAIKKLKGNFKISKQDVLSYIKKISGYTFDLNINKSNKKKMNSDIHRVANIINFCLKK